MQVTITGNQAMVSALQAKVKDIQAKANAAVQGAGLDCEGFAKQDCPVDTGRLRGSIVYKATSESSCTVGTDVSYAPPVELGTHKMPAQPFLFPAYVKAGKNLQDELQNLLS